VRPSARRPGRAERSRRCSPSRDLERTRRYRDEALAEHPDHPHTLYNVACAEAALGEHDAALEHLTRAIELEPKSREWAAKDAQFDPIREDPRFPAR
jgi:tetratricopeptide (TPR) repeat protein